MMNISGNKGVWSPAQQESSMKGDGSHNLSATHRDQALNGNEDLGELLNKVADPNWVDPKKMRKVGNNELDKDAFMKLFLAQLKNQDPMNPMESHELAAQLAQFTSLEKLNNIDQGIATMAKQSDPNKGFDALNMIGKAVAGDSSIIARSDEKSRHEIGFTIAAPAQEVELSIRNSAQQEIKKLIARDLKPGQNLVTWDGMIDSGSAAPAGDYNVVITAKNHAGQKIAAETRFEGRVTGVNFTSEGPIMMLGQQSIKMKDIKKIFDPAAMTQQTKAVDAKAVEGRDAKEAKAYAASGIAGMAGNLENVGMSQGLINKIEKEANAVQNQQKEGQQE